MADRTSLAPLEPQAALSVVAVVAMNGGEALVLNRPLRFIYEPDGKGFLGSDGPFRDVLYYEQGYGGFVAFAGRELSLPMADGSTRTVKDHWWSGSIKGYAGATYGDVESLRKCYVFSGGACIARDDLAALRATYTGCVYPYWDYEKVIKYDELRSTLWKRVWHEERRRNALIATVKAKHREMLELARAYHPLPADTSRSKNIGAF